MTARLLAQLGWVFSCDAEAIREDYAFPRKVLTDHDIEQAEHLERTANEIFDRVAAADPEQGTGTDYCFNREGT
jgi:hypothetical protein